MQFPDIKARGAQINGWFWVHDGRAAEHAPSQRRRVQVNARRTRRTEPSSGRRRRKTERTPANANANHRSHRITGGVFETLAQPCVNEQPTINRLFPPRPVPSTPTSTRRRRRAPHTPTRTAPALAHRASCPHHRTLSRTHHRNHRNHRPRPLRRRRRRRRRSRAASPPCADETSSEGTWWPPPRCGVSEVEER